METSKFKLWQRVLSLMLVVGLLAGALPISALAETTASADSLVVEYQPDSTPAEPDSVEPAPVQPTVPESGSVDSTPVDSTVTESTPESVPAQSTPESTPAESTPAESIPESSPESVPQDSSVVADDSAVEDDSVVADDSAVEDESEPEEEVVEQLTQVLAAEGATITVSYPSDAFEGDVQAVATLIAEESDKAAYDATQAALEQEAATNEAFDFTGFAAYDITFYNSENQPVEPLEGKAVSVNIQLDAQVLPEEAQDLQVVHVDDAMNTEVLTDAQVTVAPSSDTAAEVSFETLSFSTFVVTYYGAELRFYRVDQNGNQIGENLSEKNGSNSWTAVDNYAYPIDGYTYVGAYLGNIDGSEYDRDDDVNWIKYKSGKSGSWRYSDKGSKPSGDGDRLNSKDYAVYLVYKASSDYQFPGYAKLDMEQSMVLQGISLPAGVTITEAVSSNNGIVTASVSGGAVVLYGVAAGTTQVTIKTSSGKQATVWVTVSSVPEGSTTSNEASRNKVITYDPSTGKYTLDLDITGAFSTTTSKTPVDVVFVLDTSSSMDNNARLSNAKKAIEALTNVLDQNKGVIATYSLVRFDGTAEGWYDDVPYDDSEVVTAWVSGSALRSSLSGVGLKENVGTNYEAGLISAQDVLQNNASNSTKILIFLSDGQPTFHYDDEGYTGGGGSSTTSDDKNNPITFLGGMLSSFDRFYAIGCDLSGGGVLNDLVTTVNNGKGQGSAQYKAATSSTLVDIFKGIAKDLTTLACTDVEITDYLSQYVDYNGNLQFKVMDSEGHEVDLVTAGLGEEKGGWWTGGTYIESYVDVTYDEASGSVTASLPTDYELKQGYTYHLTFEVEPSQAAYDYYAQYGSYPHTGEEGTGDTSDGKAGFFSNVDETTKVTYIYNGETIELDYPMPVVQIDTQTLSITKQLASGLAPDSQTSFSILLTVNGSVGYAGSYDIYEGSSKVGSGTASNGIITLKAGQTAKVNLPAGASYQVSEPEELMSDGYVLDSIQGATGTIVKGRDASVTVINKGATATLTIQKTITGVITAQDVKANLADLTFTYLEEGVAKTVTLSQFDNWAEWSASVEGSTQAGEQGFVFTKQVEVPAGSYTVTEGNAMVPGYSLEIQIAEGADSAVVEAGGSGTVAITNYYPQKADDSTVTFSATKTWLNEAPENWSVELKLVNASGSQVGDIKTATAANPTVTWEGLSASASYHVVEVVPANSDWEQVSAGSPEVTITEDYSLRTNNCNIKDFALPDNSFFLFSATNSLYGQYAGKFILIVPDSTDDATLAAIRLEGSKAGGRFNSMTAENTVVVRASEIGSGLSLANGKTITISGGNLHFSETSIWQQVLYMTYSKAYSQTVVNRTIPKTSVTLTGTKTLSGRALAENEFEVELLENGSVVTSGKVVADGSFSLQLNYTEEDVGTHTYTVREKNTGLAGVSYDDTTYTVTVQVSQAEANGPLTVAVTGATLADGGSYVIDTAEGASTFTNSYSANGGFSVVGTKVMSPANRPIGAGEFTVVAAEYTSAEFTEVKEGGLSAQISVGTDGRFSLPLAFTQADVGTHYIRISETGSVENVQNSTATYDLTVVVQDNKDGTLSFQVGQASVGNGANVNLTSSGAAFTNTFTASAQAGISGTKTLTDESNTGKTVANTSFRFTLTGADEISKAKLGGTGSKTVSSDETGAFSFGNVTYNQDDIGKTFTYTVAEVNAGVKGYTYDDATYTVTHTVSYDQATKTIKVSEAVVGGSTITFANSYAAQGKAFGAGSTNTVANKQVPNGSLKAFTFSLYSDAELENLVSTANVDVNTGKVNFPAISYTQAGSYTYYMVENAVSLPGYTGSGDVYKIVVTMTDNGAGILVPSYSYSLIGQDGEEEEPSGDVPTIRNEYAASGSLSLTGTKTLDREILAGEFEVTVTEYTDATFETVQESGKSDAANVGTDGNFALQLGFAISAEATDAGDHYFLVSETDKGDDKIDYDTTTYQLKVTVTDNTDGTLSFAVSKLVDDNWQALTGSGASYALAEGAAFANDYNDQVTSASISGTKTLSGRTLAADQFTFALQLTGKYATSDPDKTDLRTDEEKNAAADETTNNAAGDFSFGTKTYTDADNGLTYVYTVTEENDGAAGYTYDDAVYTVEDSIRFDSSLNNGKGGLRVDRTILKNGAPVQEIGFANSYAALGSADIQLEKVLTGHTLEAGQFEFELRRGESFESGEFIETKSNDASGVVDLGELSFTQQDAGNTYTYWIKETSAQQPGYTNDTTAYKVTIQVTDNGDGTVSTDIQYYDANGRLDRDATKLVLTNSYEASGSISLTGEKQLAYRTEPIAEGEFAVEIFETDSTYALAEGADPIATAQVGADGSFALPLSYAINADGTDAGEHYYLIREVQGSDSTIEYDTTEYKVQVTVTDDNDGTLSYTVVRKGESDTALTGNGSYALTSGATFTNTYKVTGDNTFNVTGEKSFNRQILSSDAFTIEMVQVTEQEGAYTPVPGVEPITATVSADGSFTLESRAYTGADIGNTYLYQVTEISGTDANIDYSDESYILNVTVVDDGDGSLSFTINDGSYDADHAYQLAEGAAFENHYSTEGSAQIQLTKRVTGGAMQAFTFTLYNDAACTDPVLGADGKTLTATAAADGSVVFAPISYDESALNADGTGKTFTYYVKEDANQAFVDAGYTLDDTAHKVTVALSDDTNGSLTATITYDGAQDNQLVVTNGYASSGTLALTGTKQLAYRAEGIQEGEFTVEIFETDSSYEITQDAEALASVPVHADGSFDISLAYTNQTAGTHYYVVREAAGTDSNIDYDVTSYQLQVIVTDNNDGTLSYSVNGNSVGGNNSYAITTAPNATFTNTYKVTGDATFKVTGQKAINRTIKAGEFTFRMVEVNGQGTEIGTPVTATVQADGSFTLESAAFDASDIGKTYYYKVTEVLGSDENVDYDTDQSYTLTVLVVDDGDGSLSFNVNGEEGFNANNPYALTEGASFTNYYTAAGSISLAGTKTINDRDLTQGEFGFVLTAQAGAPLYDGSNKVSSKTVYNNADGSFTINGLNYTELDLGKTYTYVLTEAGSDKNGVTTDSTSYTITVVVADSEQSDGTLTFTVNGSAVANNGTYTVAPAEGKEATFENTYEASASFVLGGSKVINDRDLTEGEFSFVLADDEGQLDTTVNSGNGSFRFDAITYDQTDIGNTYTYTVTEADTDKNGVSKDETTYTVTVAVGYDSQADSMVLTVTGASLQNGVYQLDATAGKDASFENTYAAQTSEEIAGSKTLANDAITEGQFSFILTGTDEASQAKVDLLENAENGTLTVLNGAADANGVASFTFGSILYTQADIGETYTYTVAEVNGGVGGFTYDSSSFTVTHTVGYDAASDELTVTVAYTSSTSGAVSGIAFANLYEAEGEVVLRASKQLEGRELAADQFEFTLYADDQSTVLGTAKNDAAGNVVFDAIAYDESDMGNTYTYYIRETSAQADGYTNDTAWYEVRVAVANNGDGTLSTEATYVGAEDNTLVITNTYEAAGSVQVTGGKILENTADRPLMEDEFEFTMVPQNGAPMYIAGENEGERIEKTSLTVSNAAGGSIVFPELIYTQDDVDQATKQAVYDYLVSEVKGTDGTVTYDENVFTVRVTVSDEAGNGELAVTYQVLDSEGNLADGVGFENTYDTVNLAVNKVWEDNNNADRLRPLSITYNLLANGEEVAEATVGQAHGWQAVFKNFPKYDENHEEIIYTITEDSVEYYATEVTMGDAVVDNTLTEQVVTVTNTIQLGDLTILKMVPKTDYQPEFGEAVFTFTVQNTADESLSYTVPLQIDGHMEDGDYYVAMATLRGLPVGAYTVTEADTLRYELASEQPVTVVVQSSANGGEVMVASFTNKLSNEEYLSWASAVVNVYDPASGEYVPTKVTDIITDGFIVIHQGSDELPTENVTEDPFTNPDALPVDPTIKDTSLGDDEDGDPDGAGPDNEG